MLCGIFLTFSLNIEMISHNIVMDNVMNDVMLALNTPHY